MSVVVENARRIVASDFLDLHIALHEAALQAEAIIRAPIWSHTDEEHTSLREEWFAHGKREAAIAGLYLEMFGYPPGFAPYESRTDEMLGFMLSDISKDETHYPKKWRANIGEVNQADIRIMQKHNVVGETMLRRYEDHTGRELPGVVFDVVVFHHEQFDGKGYPHELHEEHLGFYTRLAMCIDQIVARIESRPYHIRDYTLREAVEDVSQYAGKLYDAQVLANLGELFRADIHMDLPETQWLGRWI